MRKVLFSILFLLLPLVSAGQGLSSGLTINTNPDGARVALEGDITISGLAPIDFPGELQGQYKVIIKEEGYETTRQTLFVTPNQPLSLTFNLKPKTRFKAAMRSLIFPGWGQIYGGRTGKGIFYTIMTAGAAGFYFIADHDFNVKLEDYNRINSQFTNATTDAEKISLFSFLGDAKQKAYDAENLRAIAIGAVIGVWGINLIDALFLYPKGKKDQDVKGLTVRPDPVEGGAKIVLSYRF